MIVNVQFRSIVSLYYGVPVAVAVVLAALKFKLMT